MFGCSLASLLNARTIILIEAIIRHPQTGCAGRSLNPYHLALSAASLIVDPITLPRVEHVGLLVITDHERRADDANECSDHVVGLINNTANLDG